MAAAPPPSLQVLEQRIRQIMETADLQTTSATSIRRLLEKEFNTTLNDDTKRAVTHLIFDILEQMSSDGEEESAAATEQAQSSETQVVDFGSRKRGGVAGPCQLEPRNEICQRAGDRGNTMERLSDEIWMLIFSKLARMHGARELAKVEQTCKRFNRNTPYRSVIRETRTNWKSKLRILLNEYGVWTKPPSPAAAPAYDAAGGPPSCTRILSRTHVKQVVGTLTGLEGNFIFSSFCTDCEFEVRQRWSPDDKSMIGATVLQFGETAEEDRVVVMFFDYPDMTFAFGRVFVYTEGEPLTLQYVDRGRGLFCMVEESVEIRSWKAMHWFHMSDPTYERKLTELPEAIDGMRIFPFPFPFRFGDDVGTSLITPPADTPPSLMHSNEWVIVLGTTSDSRGISLIIHPDHGTILSTTLYGHDVISIGEGNLFAPRLIITGHTNGETRLWDIGGDAICVLDGHQCPVWGVAFADELDETRHPIPPHYLTMVSVADTVLEGRGGHAEAIAWDVEPILNAFYGGQGRLTTRWGPEERQRREAEGVKKWYYNGIKARTFKVEHVPPVPRGATTVPADTSTVRVPMLSPILRRQPLNISHDDFLSSFYLVGTILFPFSHTNGRFEAVDLETGAVLSSITQISRARRSRRSVSAAIAEMQAAEGVSDQEDPEQDEEDDEEEESMDGALGELATMFGIYDVHRSWTGEMVVFERGGISRARRSRRSVSGVIAALNEAEGVGDQEDPEQDEEDDEEEESMDGALGELATMFGIYDVHRSWSGEMVVFERGGVYVVK
ncbi:hypothetical protein HK104_001225 [Borealophlyctis nickersoniae]|nr:hypothetical protein HK104_001225 [Borealophlyctis nickersoniae]